MFVLNDESVVIDIFLEFMDFHFMLIGAVIERDTVTNKVDQNGRIVCEMRSKIDKDEKTHMLLALACGELVCCSGRT